MKSITTLTFNTAAMIELPESLAVTTSAFSLHTSTLLMSVPSAYIGQMPMTLKPSTQWRVFHLMSATFTEEFSRPDSTSQHLQNQQSICKDMNK